MSSIRSVLVGNAFTLTKVTRTSAMSAFVQRSAAFSSTPAEGSASRPAGESENGQRAPFQRRCYNCGEQGHLAFNCPSQNKGRRCYNCGEFGHVASACAAPPKSH